MKKLLLAIASLFLITSCSTSIKEPNKTKLDGDGNVTVYLNLTPTGLIDGVSGVNIEDAKLNYGYTFTAKPGDALPDETRITSTEEGVTFGGWYMYEDRLSPGVPTIFETVPNKNNVILQAYWESDNTPSGDNGGGTTPTPGSSQTIYIDVTNITWWSNGNAALYYYTWNNSTPTNGAWPGTQTTTKEGNYYVANVAKDATHIIINRVNPSVPPTQDGAVWNQTVDIQLQSGKNLLTFTSDAKNGEEKLNAYSWSTYNA